MNEMAERLHAALMDAFMVFLGMLPDGRVEERDGYRVASAPSFAIPQANGVWVDGPDDGPAASALEASLETIRAGGVAPGVITRDHRFPRVEAEARRLGLTTVEREPGMVVTPVGFRPPEGSGPSLVRVGEDEDLLAVAKDVTTRGFEAPPEMFDSLFSSKMRAEGLDLWLAYVDGEPVSTAFGQVLGDAVGIFDVATPPEHRRKGYAAWVTAQAVRTGFEAGAAFGYLQSSEPGFGVYRALGFEQVCEYRLFVGEGGS